MTVESCLQFCGDKTYAGLEYGRECWCAAALNAQAKKLDDKECNIQCKGNKGEICGGTLMLTAYKRTSDAVRGRGAVEGWLMATTATVVVMMVLGMTI